ncbi:CHRD domain-containing protein [Hephaestia sp. GCM10023244]|uniref:CHRD domain-containing protein n=1 Tax=unclassified Hephaestia TaxID=2631281 RepID=UPI002076FB83|nr:CHRD domain-containing protein [Hephaestia sp. MAHUQ-44]MCM8729669.1 CHRD domain-containing protein [Hephaestia sp. MAHUQ-44]
MTRFVLLIPALALAGCATIAGTVGESWNAALVGGQEVPDPGDPDGTGTIRLTADSATNTVCYTLDVRDISTPTAAHIHKGARGVAGPVVLPLAAPVTGRSKECLSVDKALAAAIIADPAGYYANVHTADYPKGAIRGQLAATR